MTSRTLLTQPKVERGGAVTVITFSHDAIRDEENELARQLEGLTSGAGGRHLLLDFSKVDCLNSSELGTLITLHKQLRNAGGRLTLFNLSVDVFKLFALTRLDTLLEICRENGRELGMAPALSTPRAKTLS